jgi:hypothetical protein
VSSLWRSLAPEMRLAACAAAALGVTLLFPWYSATLTSTDKSLTPIEVFTFVEAAVLLVVAGVLYLVWARGKEKAFHLPGGDGGVISAAGAWAALLILWRMFDRPDFENAVSVGINWGIFPALVAAAALVAAGQRVRAAHRPEPRNPADEFAWERPPRRRPADRSRRSAPRDHTEVTRVLRDKPAWEGEPKVLGDEPEPDPPAAGPGGPDTGPPRRPQRDPDSQDRLF